MVKTKYISVDKSIPGSNSQNENENENENAADPAASASWSTWRLLSKKCLPLAILGFAYLYIAEIDVRLIFRASPEITEKKFNASLPHATTSSKAVPVAAAESNSSATKGTISNDAVAYKDVATMPGDPNSIIPNDDDGVPPDDLYDTTSTEVIGAWHPGYQYRYDSDANHFMNTDLLDFTNWEKSSFSRLTAPGENNLIGQCEPPPGIPKTCCPGTFSSGGSLDFNRIHTCIPALKNFPFLKQHARDFFDNNTVPLTDTQCDVCEIVEVARKHSLTIAFVGDSMHHQVFDGFTCELYRRGYDVDMSVYLYPVPAYNIYQHPHMNKTLRVHSPTWKDDSTVIIQFFQSYRLPVLNDVLDNITAQADVLITGWGLHWSYDEREHYAAQTSALYQNVTQEGHVQLMVHRETSAQHWDSDGGEYSLWWKVAEEKNLSMRCHPFPFNDNTVMWREKAVREAAKRSGHDLVMAGPEMPPPTDRPEVVVLPYFNYTAQHPNMHPNFPKRADCTHYCSTPFVYYPLWRSLRYAVNRKFG